MYFSLCQKSSDENLKGLWHPKWSTIPSFGRGMFEELLTWTRKLEIVPIHPQHCSYGRPLREDSGPLSLAVGEV